MPRYRPTIARPLPGRAQGSDRARAHLSNASAIRADHPELEWLYVRAYGGGVPEVLVVGANGRVYLASDMFVTLQDSQ